MKLGYYISGIGHGLLILWLLFGGLFERRSDEPPVPVADVSILSEEEFAALTAPPEGAPEPDPDVAPEESPTPPARPDPEPEPVVEPQPEPPAPEPVTPSDLPEEDIATPPEADRVTDQVVEAPETPTEIAPEPVDEVAPSDEPVEAPADEQEAAQPEASTTEIVTEAETPSSAPETSVRPQARPQRPEPVEVAEPEPEVTPEPDPEPETPAADPVADAIADALNQAQEGAGQTNAPLGPPMTSAERDGLRVAVSQCWNLGSTSTDAMATTVVVMVQMAPNGRPQSIEMVSSDGPNANATQTAFQAARRAIIRCGANGYNLPTEKYEQWREIEMTFNPENMRLR